MVYYCIKLGYIVIQTKEQRILGGWRMEYTQLSLGNLSFLYGHDRSPQEIISFLQGEASIRTFSQILRQLAPREDLATYLAAQLTEITGENPPSVSKKVKNWMQDKNAPKTRAQLFQICFALGFEEAQTNALLGMCDDAGIHYRNPEELVYAYGLRTGMRHGETIALIQEIQTTYPLPKVSTAACFTKVIFDEFSSVYTLEGLHEFFQAHIHQLGTYHYTAYIEYKKMLDTLISPDSSFEETGEAYEKESPYSWERVMEVYLQFHMPNSKKTSNYDHLQKIMKKYWPNSKTISNMYHQKESVSRKALLLLYLVTQEMDEAQYQNECDFMDEEDDADAHLEERIYKMNLLLNQFGMNRLDPCNPFDYVVLYAMKASEDEEMSQRMSAVFASMFS